MRALRCSTPKTSPRIRPRQVVAIRNIQYEVREDVKMKVFAEQGRSTSFSLDPGKRNACVSRQSEDDPGKPAGRRGGFTRSVRAFSAGDPRPSSPRRFP